MQMTQEAVTPCLQIYWWMGSLGPVCHVLRLLSVPGAVETLSLRTVCLLQMPWSLPGVQEAWAALCSVISSSSSQAFSPEQHQGLSPELCVLKCLFSSADLPGARLSSQHLTKRHLLKYSAVEIVPWVLSPLAQFSVIGTNVRQVLIEFCISQQSPLGTPLDEW